MALVLTEPFNDFTTNGWTLSGGPTIVAGRTGTAMQSTGSTQYAEWTVPAPSRTDTITVGFAWRYTDAVGTVRDLLALHSDIATDPILHNKLIYHPTSSLLSFTRSTSPTIASATVALTQNQWYYIECQAKLHDTTGSVIVRIDGVEVINSTGLDTKNAGDSSVYERLRLATFGSSRTGQWDDLYLRNDAVFQGDPAASGDVRLARISGRALTRGIPEARFAQIGARALTRLGIVEGRFAQIGLRALVALLPTGVTVNIWDGAAFLDAPVRTWNGTAFVDAVAVKTWNGTAFVDSVP